MVKKENVTPTKLVEPETQEDRATHVSLPASVSEKSDSGANVAVIVNDQENKSAPGPSTYLKGLPFDAVPTSLKNEFQRLGLPSKKPEGIMFWLC